MTASLLAVLIFFTVHIALAVYTISRISRTNLLTTTQKYVNSCLSLLVPYLWTVLMYYMLREEPMVFDEDEQHKQTTHNFHESNKGFPPYR